MVVNHFVQLLTECLREAIAPLFVFSLSKEKERGIKGGSEVDKQPPDYAKMNRQVIIIRSRGVSYLRSWVDDSR
jgi:hypothetical protein